MLNLPAISKRVILGYAFFDKNTGMACSDTGFIKFFNSYSSQSVDTINDLNAIVSNIGGFILEPAGEAAELQLTETVKVVAAPCYNKSDFAGLGVYVCAESHEKNICILDTAIKQFLAPPHELCELADAPGGSVINLSNGGVDINGLIAAIENNDRKEVFAAVTRNGELGYLGLFPLEFADTEKRYIRLFFFDGTLSYLSTQKAKEQEQIVKILTEYRGSMLLSEGGLIVAANSDLINFRGRQVEELMDKPFISLIAPFDKKIINQQLKKQVDTSEDILCIQKSGELFSARIATEIVDYSLKKYIVVRVSGEDLPLKMCAQYDQSCDVINSMPIMVAIGTDSNLIFANKVFINFFECASLAEFKNRYGQPFYPSAGLSARQG